MKVVAIVQARMGSVRLPGKVMRTVRGQVLIDLLLARLARAKRINEIVLATTDKPIDDTLATHVKGLGYRVVRGSEDDVLSRYAKATREAGADVVVRITGDCPLVMPELVDTVIGRFQDAGVDYFSNTEPPTYPDGFDIEVFTADALYLAEAEATERYDREHVTPFLRREARFTRASMQCERDLSHLRLTVDEPADLEVVDNILTALAPSLDFGLAEILALVDNQPQLFEANIQTKRNEGANMGQGQKLWKRAKRVIPGGNMLLSKRAEMFLPEQWPTYYDRTEGCLIWDLDGNELLDVGLMAIGTNTLGYAHPEVDDAVRTVVTKGNLSTLNCPEEVLLAERLVEINSPWAEMVRLARTGGEANSIAIRIARAASGRDGVAVCGYHGWHDWYLSANLGSSEHLAGHLLPGLSPAGVPRSLSDSTFPFMYNDFERLKELVDTRNIGVIKMEVYRNVEPQDNFLQRVRDLASAKGIVLIFDECTSGFRETWGGLYKKYGVNPDMAVYGKTLGNGYAITAVVGTRAVMEAAQSTFISSTFWTERIGPAAALKTLEVMEREKSWEKIAAIGQTYQRLLKETAEQAGLPITISGLPALTTYAVTGEDSIECKTFITQELLKQNILAGTGFYASLAHRPEHLDRLFAALGPIFARIVESRRAGIPVATLLEGPVCHTGFKRLN